jgi:cell division protein FtsW
MRLMSYLHPESDPLGAGYQVNASIQTIASGGLWGKGLGLGTRKIASVPEIHSDFIFSAFSEEAGLVGVVLYLGVLVFFAWRVYRSVWLGADPFRRLLACGLGSTIILQSFMNLGVVVGLLPATGIPLPFFSAGGSSLLVTMAMAGLLVNASAQGPANAGSPVYREVFNG